MAVPGDHRLVRITAASPIHDSNWVLRATRAGMREIGNKTCTMATGTRCQRTKTRSIHHTRNNATMAPAI